jgi:hypothetical protein
MEAVRWTAPGPNKLESWPRSSDRADSPSLIVLFKSGRWLVSIDYVGGFFCQAVMLHFLPSADLRTTRLPSLSSDFLSPYRILN